MGDFFDNRLDIYDEHQLTCIDGAKEFFRFTAECLPKYDKAKVLDLGCGTGLELEPYFKLNPTAEVVGIDLAKGMLGRLKEKFPDKSLDLICKSYFDCDFGENCFDSAVSVESLHHYTADEKLPLYRKIRDSLKDGGAFVLTDYFALTVEEEISRRNELLRLKEEQNISDGEFYHYDTPLTVEHECECLRKAGFSTVTVLNNMAQTFTLKAVR